MVCAGPLMNSTAEIQSWASGVLPGEFGMRGHRQIR